jgi:hypothetical protein
MEKKRRKKEIKCLVTEARDKCNCEWCKMFKEMREQHIKIIVKNRIREICEDIQNGKNKNKTI